MSSLNLSLPDDLKSYIKNKAEKMNSSVSEIFIDYVKQIKEKEEGKPESPTLSEKQLTRLSIAEKLGGSVLIDESISIEDLKLEHLIEKHLADE